MSELSDICADIEFEEAIEGKKLKACWVELLHEPTKRLSEKALKDGKCVSLPEGFTQKQYAKFLKKLDFMYDVDYYQQTLDGEIWYDDGTWSDRIFYEGGNEKWIYREPPPLPEFLKYNAPYDSDNDIIDEYSEGEEDEETKEPPAKRQKLSDDGGDDKEPGPTVTDQAINS